MKRKNKIWACLSPSCYTALKTVAKHHNLPATKYTLNLIRSLEDNTNIYEDTEYNSKDLQKMLFSLNDDEYKTIKDIAANRQLKTGEFIRRVICTDMLKGGCLTR
ncbi:hypothetical protein [Clostridium sp. JN-9]|uniref:hypothetical protein n=1 Tax=Clostridium sp. JN-9 TaxID=2507159 RepID=UPI000FFE0D06|nr:hypothetical protein [Clostridium sp. JN-9]QAT39544.1 hypothetical protein EQM05_04355 [Clostridium sp. JN-9]